MLDICMDLLRVFKLEVLFGALHKSQLCSLQAGNWFWSASLYAKHSAFKYDPDSCNPFFLGGDKIKCNKICLEEHHIMMRGVLRNIFKINLKASVQVCYNSVHLPGAA